MSEKNTAVRKALASYAHDTWCGWMDHLFEKCHQVAGDSGAVVIPGHLVGRYKRLMVTPYEKLSGAEQHGDLIEADKILEVIASQKGSTS